MRDPKTSPRRSPTRLSRRDVVRCAVAGAAGIAALGPFGRHVLRPASAAPLPGHRRCVVLYCYGGYDGLNLLVPTTLTSYYDRRPTIAIPAGSTLPLSGVPEYGLHPGLVNFQALFDAGHGAAFQKVGYPAANLSHFTSQDIYSEGVRGEFSALGIPESGWIARFADLYAPTPMGAVSVGVGRPLDFIGGSTNPFLVNSLSAFDFTADAAYRDNHLHRLETVKRLLAGYSSAGLDQEAATALQQGLDLAADVQAAVEAFVPPSDPNLQYPNSTPGRYLKDVATLIQHGFETEMFFTGFSGWDHHANEVAALNDRVARLDGAVGAFANHCQEMGIWDDTVIVIVSEFGRRNFENGSFGTDHGHGNAFFAFGGRVGQGVYGPTLTDLEIADQNWLDYAIDFRDVYREVIERHLGEDAAPVFPEPQDINQTLGFLPAT